VYKMNIAQLTKKSGISNMTHNVLGGIKRYLSKVIPPSSMDLEEDKREVWSDLSAIYYKYDDGVQQKAFREVISEISDNLKVGKWQTVYKKLYNVEKVGSSRFGVHGNARAQSATGNFRGRYS
jgi:hypothetical protein